MDLGTDIDPVPLHDRLLVARKAEETGPVNGVWVPDSAREKPSEGIVRAVGSGRTLENGTKIPLDVKVGDRVIFGKYSGADVRINNEDLLVLREDEVQLILREREKERTE